MSHSKDFIDQVKTQLNKLHEELSDIDRKIKSAGDKVEDWSTEQMHKLRADWHECQAHVERLSAQSQSSFNEAKAETERHWKALEAAVATYRDRIEKRAA